MGRLIVSLFVLTCIVQAALCQADCSTETGQIAFLTAGAVDNPNCYNPILFLVTLGQIPTAAQISVVCTEDCAGEMVKFLEKCPDNEDAKNNVYFLQNELCAFQDSKASNTSCFLKGYDDIEQSFVSCYTWFTSPQERDMCPDSVSNPTCAEALMAATENYDCCFQNLFGSSEFISQATQDARDNDPSLPNDFELDITDPLLFSTCKVSLPNMCDSAIASAQSVAATPLLALLLLAFIAKLVAF